MSVAMKNDAVPGEDADPGDDDAHRIRVIETVKKLVGDDTAIRPRRKARLLRNLDRERFSERVYQFAQGSAIDHEVIDTIVLTGEDGRAELREINWAGLKEFLEWLLPLLIKLFG